MFLIKPKINLNLFFYQRVSFIILKSKLYSNCSFEVPLLKPWTPLHFYRRFNFINEDSDVQSQILRDRVYENKKSFGFLIVEREQESIWLVLLRKLEYNSV